MIAVTTLVAGCAGTSSQETSGSRSGAAASSASSSAPASAATSAAIEPSIEERCNFAADGAIHGVVVDDESTLAVARMGAGTTAMVLLPQVSGGMCGAMPWAGWAATQGVSALPVDMCGDGDSECGSTAFNDPLAQVKAVVTWARETAEAKRVVVVGASAGGAIALGVAQEAGADAVVDLSGPANWSAAPDAEVAAKATTIPLLIVCAEEDQGSFPARLRAAVAGSPATVKKYVEAPDGHGWSMLSNDLAVDPEITDVGKDVLAWVLKPSS